MLHSLRRRLQQAADREAAGESLWTPGFDARVRTRVMHVVRQTASGFIMTNVESLFAVAQGLIVAQEGLYTLTGTRTAPHSDFFEYFQTCEDAMFPTVLEALVLAFEQVDEAEARQGNYRRGYAEAFSREANEILAQERIAWELIDHRMVEIHSKELHMAAVEPAIRLLHQSRFASADQQYRDALDELAQGKAADAITDAGATLQELLEALGCEGNQLGDLVRSAKRKGLLGAHDTPLLDAIEKTLHWVAADRSEMGDAHHATQATREDAWLIVHVVGALIVRLASGQDRRK
jgi:hypothetical protein